MRVAYVQRENETAYTIATYLTHAVSVMGLEQQAALAQWNKYVANPNIERSEDSTDQDPELWIATAKTRSKEKIRYEDGSFEEGSKDMKNLSSADVTALKTFALSSANSHANSFLRQKVEADPSSAASAVPELEESLTKKRKVKLAVAGPQSYAKYSRQLGLFMTSMGLAVEQMNAAQAAYDSWLTEHKSRMVPKEMASYARSLEINRKLYSLWHAGEADATTVAATLALAAQAPPTPGAPAPTTPAFRAWTLPSGSPSASRSPQGTEKGQQTAKQVSTLRMSGRCSLWFACSTCPSNFIRHGSMPRCMPTTR